MKKLKNRLICGTALMIMISLSGTGNVCAGNYTWDGSEDNNWSALFNWVGGQKPDGDDTVIFDDTCLTNYDSVCDYDLTGIKIEILNPFGPITVQVSNGVSLGIYNIDMRNVRERDSRL